MNHRPRHLAAEYAEPFKDQGVAEAYRHRPSYPPETFEILAGLVATTPRHVLDVGCGPGNIARHLITRVDRVDAVDFSEAMIRYGRQLPNGDHPSLRWLHGRVEDVALDPPYGLVTAGDSLHWMDWNVALPRFREVLVSDAYLAVVGVETVPDPWSMLAEIIPKYRADGGFQPFDMIAALERNGLFRKVGERRTAPESFTQSIDEYIESYHSRAGFSRERMGQKATAFDGEARRILLQSNSDELISLQVSGSVVWGFPQG